ncbi:MAG TPA: Wzz/FepE/Etk N-terminal domain-containing protein, partial [Fimbriiglobus sp.]|nr:Wzz/FepE/Etk N-terminal domain-containing protein [Fimbriiglobus sp.]
MADDRTPDLDLPPDLDAPTAGPSPLQVVARRWPLLAVGLVAGAVIGVLIHLASTPIYQSGAQLLVIKKRETLSASDARSAVVEDYVAAQMTLIKSEKIRRAAVKELRPARLNLPLPADDLAAAEMIRGGLATARDKDTTSANQIGSGVVNLS